MPVLSTSLLTGLLPPRMFCRACMADVAGVLQGFMPRLLHRCGVECFVTGNYSLAETQRLGQHVESILQVPCCAVMGCAVIPCAVVCCAVLCCAVLCCAMLCWNTVCCAVPCVLSAVCCPVLGVEQYHTWNELAIAGLSCVLQIASDQETYCCE